MNILKAIGNFFKKPAVQEAAKDITKAALGSSTPGQIINMAMDLGAFDFIANLLGKSVAKVSGSENAAELSTGLLSCITKAIVDTQNASDAGQLTTSEQKRAFALDKFKNYMLSNEYVKSHPNIIQIAPILIELVYQTGQLKVLLDAKNRDQVVNMMISIGTKALTDKTVDPVKEFFTQLDLLNKGA